MNMIASELLCIASELLPRIRMTFIRNDKTEDRDLSEIHLEIQRFASTLRKNENLECFVTRKDDGETMEITVGFTNHEQMTAIVQSMSEMAEKLGKKKSNLKVTVKTSPDGKLKNN